MTTFSRTAEQSVADRTPTPLALSMHPDGYMTDPTGELQVHFCDGAMIEIWAGGGFVRLDAGDLPLLIKAARLLLPPGKPLEPSTSGVSAAAPSQPLWIEVNA